MLGGGVMEAEHHACSGNRRNSHVVECLPIATRHKMQGPRLELEGPAIEHRSDVLGNGAWILPISCQPLSGKVLVYDTAIRITHDNDVFNAGQNRIIKG